MPEGAARQNFREKIVTARAPVLSSIREEALELR